MSSIFAPTDLTRSHRPDMLDGLDPAASLGALTQNPHPGGQREHNTPTLGDTTLSGIQHKYADTVLAFPAKGQTCHAYCAYCFRWAQFVGDDDLQMGLGDPAPLTTYLAQHPEVSNVILTGGDPLVMGSAEIGRWIDALCGPGCEHIDVIRIGTKAPLSHPERILRNRSGTELLVAIEKVVASGRQCAIMLHSSHPRELEAPKAQAALRALQNAGAVVYSQAPIVRYVNDSAAVWAAKWQLESRLGVVPYYMFVERDTGAHRYFAIPLAKALEIFEEALSNVGGLARTVRGPVMSTTTGKLLVARRSGPASGFHLEFLRSRNDHDASRTIHAQWDANATWVSELTGATSADNRLLMASAGDHHESAVELLQKTAAPRPLMAAEVATSQIP